MATKHHNTIPFGAAVSILLALAIGFTPIATMLALASTMETLS